MIKTASRSPRAQMLDAYRGLAVILMIIFHFCWDLKNFGYLHYSLDSPFWVGFRYIIVFLFLSAVGWSSFLAQHHRQAFSRFCYHQFKIAISAITISLGTYLAMPKHWVFFGILHFIFIASWAVRPFSKYALLSFGIGTTLIIMTYALPIDTGRMRDWFSSELGAPHYTLDYLSPLPWLGVVFIGPIYGYLKLEQIPLWINPVTRVLTFTGRNALTVYLSHQLVLYPMVASAHFLFQ